MILDVLDWTILVGFFILTMMIGLWASRTAGSGGKEFFLSGRNLPWWLLGISMVATTFSADTPNLVTDIVRQHGIAGNWVWWAFLLTGMTTTIIYSKLWRRSGLTTDVAFYELRYSGPEAAFLRGFRSVYLGVFFNIMIMATVLLAGIKLGAIILGLTAEQTVLIVGTVTVIYSALGGLRGIVWTDFFQFGLAMIGMLWAAYYIINMDDVGGLSAMLAHDTVLKKTSFIPDICDWSVALPLFFIPLAVQWWSSWYPGAEPGGGGYVAQRMLSTKTEIDAVKATVFFNLAHYALRPWPWILIALASLIMYPELSDLQSHFPNVSDDILGHDLAFPAMLSALPPGLLGLVIASLIAALMSTLSTHLNWGASYIVHDVYKRFLRPDASAKNEVLVGRLATLALMVLSAILALYLKNAYQAFNILLQIGAGTGLLFLLRWFWWRINATSEIVAMIVSFVIAFYFETQYEGDWPDHVRLVIGVSLTTLAWMAATYIGKPTDLVTLRAFYKKIRPHRLGWKAILSSEELNLEHVNEHSFGNQIAMIFFGSVGIYSLLFALGHALFARWFWAFGCGMLMMLCFYLLSKLWTSYDS